MLLEHIQNSVQSQLKKTGRAAPVLKKARKPCCFSCSSCFSDQWNLCLLIQWLWDEAPSPVSFPPGLLLCWCMAPAGPLSTSIYANTKGAHFYFINKNKYDSFPKLQKMKRKGKTKLTCIKNFENTLSGENPLVVRIPHGKSYHMCD